MRWVLAAVVVTAIALLSGCQHVSPLWPLKTDAAPNDVHAA